MRGDWLGGGSGLVHRFGGVWSGVAPFAPLFIVLGVPRWRIFDIVSGGHFLD